MGAAASAVEDQSNLAYPSSGLTHRSLDLALDDLYGTQDFALEVADRLGAIIRVPSESYDDFGKIGEDDRWQTFAVLHTELKRLFPSVYETLDVVNVNTYAQIITWRGTETNLLPLMLTAHMDVVPVDASTSDSWTYPPYSGYFDGTWVWGRGTCDDKVDLLSLLTTVESMIKAGFVPSRTIVLAFGIDEESAGTQGAPYIAQYLEDIYGKNKIAAILDEGAAYETPYGGNVIFANPATAEKGYLDLRVEVSTPGGHSSVPPSHTGIGMLASVIAELEAHPHEPSLKRSDTFFQEIQCAAAFGPELPESIKQLAYDAVEDDNALGNLSQALLEWDPAAIAKLSTTQAVDVISGGVKVNALPENVWALVNHRIAEHSSVSELQDRIISIVGPVAVMYNLTLRAFGKNITTGDKGQLTLTDAFDTALEPAPTTPVRDSEPYGILAGTIVAALQSSPGYDGSQIIVSPSLAIDTKSYWNLTRNIYRYAHVPADAYFNGLHTVNEAIKLDAVIGRIRFYTRFILNWDEAAVAQTVF
ncbi:hypothetical protein PHLGIDRAFT_402333 [Phlebiopsis gigantea 11061_1 CR5-6]|uniref:Peptidase M20 dimerisation domain-containing protein n=1 Tax=Phlebiopsis gigantea (strain 11061_1 CR5-6) TaxID=745531 RepID=A0A0C3RZU6_PHLG1|nr:hypothetical protein PHLGIDRAFT_402333 [Phlebiopsis gigantea 11061_1 CR5-6]